MQTHGGADYVMRFPLGTGLACTGPLAKEVYCRLLDQSGPDLPGLAV